MGDPRTLAMHLNLTQQILERIQSCKYKTIMRTMGVDQGELIAPAFPPCGEQLRVGCFFRLNIELVSVGRRGAETDAVVRTGVCQYIAYAFSTSQRGYHFHIFDWDKGPVRHFSDGSSM